MIILTVFGKIMSFPTKNESNVVIENIEYLLLRCMGNSSILPLFEQTLQFHEEKDIQ